MKTRADRISESEVFPGIRLSPSVRFGKPCLTGTRIDVATVVAAVASEGAIESVQQAFRLTRKQVLTALRYAAHVAAHLPPAVSQVA